MAKVIMDDGSNHKPTKTIYGTNADGLPVPESMHTSKRSLIRCLFSSTELVLHPVFAWETLDYPTSVEFATVSREKDEVRW